MLTFLTDLVGGWSEVRSLQGFSYQVSRNGKRRVLPVEDYGRRGEIDEKWVETGEFTDVGYHKKYRKHNLIPAPRGRVQYANA